MPISNDRRYYLTLPDADYKQRLIKEAAESNMKPSEYIVHCLELVKLVDADPVGHVVLQHLNGK